MCIAISTSMSIRSLRIRSATASSGTPVTVRHSSVLARSRSVIVSGEAAYK